MQKSGALPSRGWPRGLLQMIKRIVALSLLFAPSASAKDNGQCGKNVGPEVRAWFNSVTNALGARWCDISDGYPVEYEMRANNHSCPA
jgi:hypothetical protein